MFTNKEIILGVGIILLGFYVWQQQTKIAKLSETTSNEETLSWTDYKGYKYDIVIRRQVHGGAEEAPTTIIR